MYLNGLEAKMSTADVNVSGSFVTTDPASASEGVEAFSVVEALSMHGQYFPFPAFLLEII